MRRLLLLALAALAWPVAAPAQSFVNRDWQVVCDNTRTCRAAGYSAEGSENPVSVLVSRASGPGRPVVGELQLGALDAQSARPASVTLMVAGRAAGIIRIDRNNHADLAPAVTGALLKALLGGADVAFAAGKTTWRLSGDGAVDALQKIDDTQFRAGTRSALVRTGTRGDADVASPVALPRFEAGNIPPVRAPGDDALAVRVLAGIHAGADCPLLDDGAAQARARLWHLDENRLLVTQPCRAGAQGYWVANQRPPFDPKPLTYAGAEFDGSGTITARAANASGSDCGSAQAWTWNGYRFEQTYAATGGLCRGVKAGGAWELPSLVADVVPGK